MPNWVSGNIRIRGNAHDIIRFMTENAVYARGNDVYKPAIKYDESFKELHIWKPDNCKWGELWFDGLRHYITGYILGLFDDNDFGVLIMDNFNAAWLVKPEKYMEWSTQYGIDFRIYGFEQGMRFGQDIIIEHGELTKNEILGYSDWDWECPHPNWGG